jgi:hypothetical protein
MGSDFGAPQQGSLFPSAGSAAGSRRSRSSPRSMLQDIPQTKSTNSASFIAPAPRRATASAARGEPRGSPWTTPRRSGSAGPARWGSWARRGPVRSNMKAEFWRKTDA